MVDRWFPVGGSRPFRMSFEILKFLVLNPRKTPFAIEKATKIDRPTVYAAIDLLHRAQLIKKEGEKKHAMGVSRTYVANVRGFVALLQADSREIILNANESRPKHFKVTKKDVQAFAEKKELQDFLPLIFGKWKHFRDVEAEDLAYEQLLVAANQVASKSNDEVRKLSEISKGADPSPFDALEGAPAVLRDEIYEQMFRRRFFNPNRRRDPLGEAISADPEILQRIERQIQWERKNALEEVNNLDMWLKIIRGEATTRDQASYELSMENSEWLNRFAKANVRYERAVGLDKGVDPSTIPTEQEAQDNLLNAWIESLRVFVVLGLEPHLDPDGKVAKAELQKARLNDESRQDLIRILQNTIDGCQEMPEIDGGSSEYAEYLRLPKARLLITRGVAQRLGARDFETVISRAESLVEELKRIDPSDKAT